GDSVGHAPARRLPPGRRFDGPAGGAPPGSRLDRTWTAWRRAGPPSRRPRACYDSGLTSVPGWNRSRGADRPRRGPRGGRVPLEAPERERDAQPHGPSDRESRERGLRRSSPDPRPGGPAPHDGYAPRDP